MDLSEIIKVAMEKRPDLAQTIGYSETCISRSVAGLSECLASLYRCANGTPRGIKNQAMMDIVPGFRLIHRDELLAETERFRKAYPHLHTHYPFFGDYASCYYTVDSADGVVYYVDRECEAKRASNTLDQYLTTIFAFYKRGVFFLDKDGYLDFDFEHEELVGAELNPGCAFWTE